MATDLYDLRLAIINIGEADTGTDGLVDLTGKDQPIQKWADIAEAGRPVVAFRLLPFPPTGGTSGRYEGTAQFDTFVELNQDDVANDMVARLRTIINTPHLKGEGVDAVVRETRMNPQPELDMGRHRLTWEADITYRE